MKHLIELINERLKICSNVDLKTLLTERLKLCSNDDLKTLLTERLKLNKDTKIFSLFEKEINDTVEHIFKLSRQDKTKKLYKVIREGNYTSMKGLPGFFFRNCNTLPLGSSKSVMVEFMKSIEAANADCS